MSIREQVALMMEHNEELTKLSGMKWHNVEDTICNLIFNILGISESEEEIFSECEKSTIDDPPTDFEEEIFRRVERYYHKQDILDVIADDQEERGRADVPLLFYTCKDIDNIINRYESKMVGELDLAHEALRDYQYELCVHLGGR